MALLFSLAVALPFACLALLSLISFLAIMAIGGVIHALRAVPTVGGTGPTLADNSRPERVSGPKIDACPNRP